MPLGRKIKCVFMRFRHTAKFAVSPSNLKNLTASPGVERARKPSVYFFGTFFVQAKKVRLSAAAILAGEQAKITNFIFRETVPVCAA